MMLAKLSLKNIRKSLKDYAIYFFTLILGVAIFYVFNAIDSQTVLLNVTSSTYEIIKLMTNMLSGVSVFVSFILGFLIIYASNFLIKRRKKEFGIYLTLGMSKRKISTILLIETIFIGIISLIVGLILGVSLSQLMSLLVANMFEADMTEFRFLFSETAFIKTLIYFGIMYIIVMIFNTISVGKCRLIELIHGDKKAEEIKLKNTLLCVVIFTISCIALGYAYYLVTDGIYKITDFDMIFLPIALGSVSTFFIFWSLSGLLLKIFMSMKHLYYKGLNSFVLRQFSSKINTMVFSMSFICLMLFVTICVLSSALSIKNSMTAGLNELAPVDIELQKRVNYTQENTTKYTDEQLDRFNLSVKETLEQIDMAPQNYLSEFVEIDIYSTPDLTIADTLGDNLETILQKFKYLNASSEESIVKLSEYNRLAHLYGTEEFALDEDEYIIVADFDSFISIRNESLESNTSIEVFNHTLHPKYDTCQNGFIEMSSNHINDGIIIVPDAVVDEAFRKENVLIGNYIATSKDGKKKAEAEFLKSLSSKNDGSYLLTDITTRLTIAEASTGLGAMVTFIGLYLGIIFLISSAAILALKELSESADNASRYRMIRKLGADEHLINRALLKQNAIMFATPLVLAIIHSIFGLKFCTFILESFGTKELFRSILMTATFLIAIYGTYFIITYYSSKNMIKERI